MADAKIINYGQPIGAGSTAIPDGTSVALNIESTDAKDYITIDTSDGTETITLGQQTVITGPGGTTGFSIPATNCALLVENSTGDSNTACTIDINGDGSGGAQVRFREADTEYSSIVATDASFLVKTESGNKPIILSPHGSGEVQVTGAVLIGTDLGDITSPTSLHVRNDSVGGQATFQRDSGKLIIEQSAAETTLNSNVDMRFQAGNGIDMFIKSSNGNVGFQTTTPTAEVETVGHIVTVLTGKMGTGGSSSTTVTGGTGGDATNFGVQLHIGSAIKLGSDLRTVTAIDSASTPQTLTVDTAVTAATGSTGYYDSGELFAVKTGDSRSILSVNENGSSSSVLIMDTTASGNIAQVNNNANALVVDSSGDAGISIAVAGNNPGRLSFVGVSAANVCGLQAVASNTSTNALYLYSNGARRMKLDSTGKVGIATTAPGQILDVNYGSGNMIADGYDTHSLAAYKENINAVDAGYLAKVTACTPKQWTGVPYVSADEIKSASIENFGQDAWDGYFPEEDAHRAGALLSMPEGEMKTWIDAWAESRREERRTEEKWQQVRLGLVADGTDTAENLPEVVSKNNAGEVSGINTMSYIGTLHAAIVELAAKVATLEAGD